ncbi:MAG: hypothetical protein WCH29_10795 [Chitinophagaceae bacterium]
MNTRRNFILQSSLASSAFLVANPFKSIANSFLPVTGSSVNNNKIIFLHTGTNSDHRSAHQQMNAIKKATANIVMLHTGSQLKEIPNNLRYDVAINQGQDDSIKLGDYKIMYKGDIKIGIITASHSEAVSVDKINNLSTYLKKTRDCQIVVCLSQLGYKNAHQLDDRKLAEQSVNLDLIISGHATNYSKHTLVAANTNREEVIIHFASGNGFDFGSIEILFDKKGYKNSIAINNLISRKTA